MRWQSRRAARALPAPLTSLLSSLSSILNHDLRKRRRVILLLLGDLDGDAACDLPVDLCGTAVGIRHHGGHPGIRLLADLDVQRQRAEQLDAVILAHALAATCAEDPLLMAAVAADVQAHVLDDTEDRDADLFKHL